MSFIGSHFFKSLLAVVDVRMRFEKENVKFVGIVLVDEMQKVDLTRVALFVVYVGYGSIWTAVKWIGCIAVIKKTSLRRVTLERAT